MTCRDCGGCSTYLVTRDLGCPTCFSHREVESEIIILALYTTNVSGDRPSHDQDSRLGGPGRERKEGRSQATPEPVHMYMYVKGTECERPRCLAFHAKVDARARLDPVFRYSNMPSAAALSAVDDE